MPLTRKQKQRNAAMLKTAEPVPPTQLEIEKMSTSSLKIFLDVPLQSHALKNRKKKKRFTVFVKEISLA